MHRTVLFASSFQTCLTILSVGALVGPQTARGQCVLAFDYQDYSDPGAVIDRAMVVGDLNHDGALDLVSAGAVSDSLPGFASIRLNAGDGSFLPAVEYAACDNPQSVAIGDLNLDTHLDVVTTCYLANTVSVLLGNGDGTLQPAAYYPTDPGPWSVAIGDLDSDGILDLAVANFDTPTVSVLLGNGDGTFQPHFEIDAGGEFILGLTGMAIGDLNGDGSLDLLVTSFSGAGVAWDIMVLLGNGDGSFQEPMTYFLDPPQTLGGFVSVAIGDLNADDVPDVTMVPLGKAVFVLLGNGDGTLQPAVPYDEELSSVAIGDMDGDGLVDLVTTHYGSVESIWGIRVLPGNGDGSFQAPVEFDSDSVPWVAALGDFNLDNQLDIAVDHTLYSHRVTVLMNESSSYPAPTITQQPDGQVVDAGSSVSFSVAAITGSGLPLSYQWRRDGEPLADGGSISGANSNTLTISSAQATDMAHYDVEVSIPGCGGEIAATTSTSVVLAVTGGSCGRGAYDGDADGDRTVGPLVARGQCDLVFDKDDYSGAGSSFDAALAVGDFNHDGAPDLAGVGSIRLNAGDGTFLPAVEYFACDNGGYGSAAVGDLNLDGHPDAVSVCFYEDAVSVLLDNGDGTFQAPLDKTIGAYPASVVIGDLNQDGWPDLAVAFYAEATISVLLGNGDGTFQTQVDYDVSVPLIQGLSFMAIGDLNVDGRLDLVTTDRGTVDTVSILLGNGDGTFQAADTFHEGGIQPVFVVVGDVNADGLPDVITANSTPNVSVLLGNGDGTLQPSVEYGAGGGPFSVAIGDIDADGLLDLVTANLSSSDIKVLPGNGDGSFQAPLDFDLGVQPFVAAVDDFNQDDRLDIAAASGAAAHRVAVLLNIGSAYLAPTITQQPDGQVVSAESSAAFSIAAITNSGLPISYQWRRNGQPLVDGGSINGANSNTLTIDPAQPSDMAYYDVEVSIPGCGGEIAATTSTSVVLAVTGGSCEPAPCDGDANGDGIVDPLDTGYVLSRFGCPVGTGNSLCDAADVNDDGIVDPLDSGYVLSRFGPCP